MPRDPQILIFVGIKDSVIALDDRTGTEAEKVRRDAAAANAASH